MGVSEPSIIWCDPIRFVVSANPPISSVMLPSDIVPVEAIVKFNVEFPTVTDFVSKERKRSGRSRLNFCITFAAIGAGNGATEKYEVMPAISTE